MWRDIGLLSTKKFDVLVIGGGIHGATIAREAAEAGFSVALVEKNDFCSGVSANSLKVIHGGIRYLQHLDIKRMRESIRSRNRLLREFPHLVRPLPCLTPTYGHGLKGREVMAVALKLNDLIAWDRNKGLGETSKISGGSTMGRRECLAIIPGIREQGLTGGAVWHDALAVNTERLVLEFLHQAVLKGAVVANHIEVDGFQRSSGSITGVHLTDTPTGEKFTIHPRFIINAGGAGVDRLATMGGQKTVASGWAKAVNLVVSKKFFGEYAVGLEGVREFYDRDAVVQKGKRLFFFVPWRGKTMIGTTYAYHQGDLVSSVLSRVELEEFVSEVNRIYPRAALSPTDVDYVHCGLVPILDEKPPEQGDVLLDKTTTVVEYGSAPTAVSNFFTVKGVKYTTAVEVAAGVVRMIGSRLGFPAPSSLEESDEMEHGTRLDVDIDPEIRERLTEKYGPRRAQRVSAYLTGEGSEVLSRDPWCVHAEILHGIREEAALHLEDIFFRRTELASAGCPDLKVVERVATIMAKELGWSQQRRTDEIQGFLAHFAMLNDLKRQ